MPTGKLKVLLVVEAAAAGVGRHVLDLAEGLVESGQVVHIAYSPLRSDRVFADRVEGLKGRVSLFSLPMVRSISPIADWRAMWELRRYVLEHGPFDIVHGHSSKAGAVSRLLGLLRLGGIRTVYTPHAFITMSPGIGSVHRFVFGLVERVLANVLGDAVIAVSSHEADHARRLGIKVSRIHVIPNGVQVVDGSRAITRAQYGFRDSDIIIGFVGRLDYQKAPEVLLEAFHGLVPSSRLHLVMIGDGPKRGELEALVTAYGLDGHVHLLGFRTNPRELLAMFDIFVLPSRYEGMPYALLEAMATGLPVVATQVAGNVDLVRPDHNGYLVPCERSDTLAEALERLVQSPDLRKKMGQASRRSVEGVYTIDSMTHATLAVYHEICR